MVCCVYLYLLCFLATSLPDFSSTNVDNNLTTVYYLGKVLSAHLKTNNGHLLTTSIPVFMSTCVFLPNPLREVIF